MKKLLFMVGLFFLLVGRAQAATLTLSWTKIDGAVPATQFRIEEQTGSTWGNLQGTTGATVIPASNTQYVVSGRAIGSMATFRLVPMANNVDGTPSNSTTCGVLAPSTTVNLTCSATNP